MNRPNMLDPVQFLAFGFGSGLSPKAPGTVGKAVALLLYWLAPELTPVLHAVVLLPLTAVGIWLCGEASRRLGVHDHGGIGWDEFIGLWISGWALPKTLPWMVAAFLLFRWLDIRKPGPIGWLDRNTHGGFGIMIDDVAAGVVASLILLAALHSGVLDLIL